MHQIDRVGVPRQPGDRPAQPRRRRMHVVPEEQEHRGHHHREGDRERAAHLDLLAGEQVRRGDGPRQGERRQRVQTAPRPRGRRIVFQHETEQIVDQQSPPGERLQERQRVSGKIADLLGGGHGGGQTDQQPGSRSAYRAHHRGQERRRQHETGEHEHEPVHGVVIPGKQIKQRSRHSAANRTMINHQVGNESRAARIQQIRHNQRDKTFVVVAHVRREATGIGLAGTAACPGIRARTRQVARRAGAPQPAGVARQVEPAGHHDE